ncbi:GntR family transcriptional regulator [Alsobacter soli]|uniref:GntR family transcriptional regulator n=1 Tax=Alsobacter soli TaxID=2109933 RepID=A0A2T1HQW7_9HYPH|nr:GntR family transcriptional regulator [Alsobacter soli]PSC04048.1 GntR family transcriptional regulator [Alsobacter soli]
MTETSTIPPGVRLRDLIEQAILTGDFPPGEKLEEVALAQRFGVSRTPVREALHQLSAAGLVESRPRRGAVVATITPERLIEMFEVMAELEAFAAKLAARRLTPETEAAIVEAHRACKAALSQGPDAYYYENERFHFAIYQASRNGFLIEQATALHRRLKPYRRLQLRVRNRVAASFDEHGAIVDAIRSGKAKKAATLIREHISVQGERFADLMASLPSLKAG